LLGAALSTWSVIVVMGVLLFGATVLLGMTANSELAPEEDQGFLFYQLKALPDATSNQMLQYAEQMFNLGIKVPEYQMMFQITTPGQGFGGMVFKPWDERTRTATQLQQVLQGVWGSIAGGQVFVFPLPALPGAQGAPVQVVINTTEPFQNLNEVAQAVLNKARDSGKFYFVDTDLKIDKPQSTLLVDRDLVSSLGLTQQDVGSALTAALGGGYVNYFSIAGRSYKVIPQVLQTERLNPDQVLDYYVKGPNGSVIPAATVASIKNAVVPESINRFQQLNSATISGATGMSQGEALKFFRDALAEVAPTGYHLDYSGQSRQFVQESGGFATTLLFAVIIVFLALAAQFNSLRDPIVILVSVPMALFGALIFVNLISSLNIYTQVGLVTLMGLVSKHGILIVQFANESQRGGMSKAQAIQHAAGVRLRPILMTTAAMVLGVIPLVIATGAGAAGRFAMGLVISTGLAIGTLFTLFVVPAFYMLLAADHHAEARREHEAGLGDEGAPA
jgi:multidrug efflux pump